MSLRDLGIFAPLHRDHPLVRDRERCWRCGRLFAEGDRCGLLPLEAAYEVSGHGRVEAKPVCATCMLQGREIGTPAGRRIVERVKDGDGSPYPIVTADGQQWADDEVQP